MTDKIAVSSLRLIEWQRVGDMICGALEGNGSGDWVTTFHVAQDDLSATLKRAIDLHDGFWYADGSYWRDGGKAIITYEEGKLTAYQQKTFGREDIERGLALMAEKSPRHFNDLVEENDDAITSDVFMQYCVLGEIVFG